MKKSYFSKSFNLNIYLFIISALGFLFSTMLNYLILRLDNIKLLSPPTLQHLTKLHHSALLVSSLVLTCLVLSVTAEVISHSLTDSVLNYLKSIFATVRFRQFARQNERINKTPTDTSTQISVNPIFRDFNRAVGKSVVDITRQKIFVYIKIPRSQQSQKILREMEAMIKEEISSRNPDYYFSSPERFKNHLWFIGTKR